MKVGVVIPVGAGRRENVEDCLRSLDLQTVRPELTVLVYDGHNEMAAGIYESVWIPKHEPGAEQPRNVGVRRLLELDPSITHAWFVDSDILMSKHALAAYVGAAGVVGEDAVMYGPYEWMPPGQREPMPELTNDPRWQMFREREMGPFVADLGVALGCFSGNLVWPVEAFMRVGGFHPQLHHGRCEDGELGLRGASHRVPMALVPAARGYHMWHEVNYELVLERNKRDVPLLNSWHKWVEEKGLIVTDQDGARFDYRCHCGAQVNTLEMWSHWSEHDATEREDSLILPEGLR